MQESRFNIFQGNSDSKDRVKENLVLLDPSSSKDGGRFRYPDY